MEPNKFEKHIKKRLQEREITPSANAWNRISEQLEDTESPKSNIFFRFAVAASFIGFLLVSVWYFNGDIEVTDVPSKTVVQSPVDSSGEEKKSNKTLERTLQEDKIVVKEDESPDRNTPIDPLPETNDKIKSTVIVANNENQSVEKVLLVPEISHEAIDSKIAEIVARVDLLEKQNDTVTDAEIDTLLRQAQQEILESKIFRQDRSVDAMALLADVENELDKSFRDQIFEALKDGFVKVRTAVADRNK